MLSFYFFMFFFFKQKTAYEMRISDWSSDVCSSDLPHVDALCLRAKKAEVVDVRCVEGADQQDAMVKLLRRLVQVERSLLHVALANVEVCALEGLHCRWKVAVKILPRHIERLLRCLRSRSMKLLVIELVKRDAVLRDIHEEITPVREPVVHFLDGVDDEIDRRVESLVDRQRSEERRVGKEGVSTCRSRWS